MYDSEEISSETRETALVRRLLLGMFVVVSIIILLSLTTATDAEAVSVSVKVYRVQEVDPIETFLEGSPDWYYYVGFDDGSGLQWTPPQGLFVGTDVVINEDWSYGPISSPNVKIIIGFCEDDFMSGDDEADVSSYGGSPPGPEGFDNVPQGECGGDTGGKPTTIPAGFFLGSYNIVSDSLTGEVWDWNGGYRRTRGTSDGNGGDENDANVWFDVWDNYVFPGCGGSIGPTSGTEGVTSFNFDGYGTDGLTPYTYEWNFDDGATSPSRVTTHTYSTAGQYSPIFTVWDSAGESKTCGLPSPLVVDHRTPGTVSVGPPSTTIPEGGGQLFSASVSDYYGHDITSPSTITWSVSPSGCGFFSPSTGSSTTFTASSNAGGQTCTITGTATYSSWSGGDTSTVTVEHAGPITVGVNPPTAVLTEGAAQSFSGAVTDQYGHDITSISTISWSVTPSGCGSFSPASGPSTTFTSSTNAGGQTCTVTASATYSTWGDIDTASVTVNHAGPISVVVSPNPVNVAEGAAQFFSSVVTDQNGHDITSVSTVSWSVTPSGCGSLSPPTGSATTFIASTNAGGQTCSVTASATYNTWSDGDSASVTVDHGGPITVGLNPLTATVTEGSAQSFSAVVTDQYGHDITSLSTITWSATPPTCGAFLPSTGPSTTYTSSTNAGGQTCSVTVSATYLTWSDSDAASVTVNHAGPITVGVNPSTAMVAEGGGQTISAVATDQQLHDITSASTISWSVTPSGCGSLSPPTGSTTTFTSSTNAGGQICTVTASATYSTWSDTDTASVMVNHAGPFNVVVSPSGPVSVIEGAGQSFSSVVTDVYLHDITTDSTVTWSVMPLACGSFSPSAGASTTFTSSADAGGQVCTITASATHSTWSDSDTSSVDVTHAGPTTVAVSPSSTSITEGTAQSLTVVVTDLNGHDVTSLSTVSWSVDPVSCGSFSPVTGSTTSFTSSTDAGGQVCTVTASATFESYQNDGNADIDVVHAALDSVAVSPGTATIDEGYSQFFYAIVTDQYGHNITDLVTLSWSVDPVSCGSYSPITGSTTSFTSSSDAGGQVCTVSAESQGTSGTASVTVMAPLEITASADPNSGDPPLTVSFTGLATGGTAPYTFSWDFDDGSTSSDQNPSHTFTTAGTYTVTLTVTDNASESILDTVTVYMGVDPLTVTISADPATGYAPLDVDFTSTIGGGTAPYAFSWDFGDGSTSSEENPSHVYNEAGSYQVVLTVTDDDGAVEENDLTVTTSVSVQRPTIEILEPADNSDQSSPFTISGTCTNATKVEVKIDTGDWYQASLEGSEWSFLVENLAKGSHTIKARACDPADDCSDVSTVQIQISATEPDDWAFWLAILVVIIIVSIIAVLLLMKRRQVEETPEQPEKEPVMEPERCGFCGNDLPAGSAECPVCGSLREQ